MAVRHHASQTLALIEGEPTIHRIGIARAKEARPRHGIGSDAIRDLQECSAAFPHVGMGAMVTAIEQILSLLRRQLQRPACRHGGLLSLLSPWHYRSSLSKTIIARLQIVGPE
jgi:hypothetical protein